jgi:hypothetical protein
VSTRIYVADVGEDVGLGGHFGGLAMGNLTALAVKNAKPGDKLGDGDGLRLDVDKNGNRSWVFRYTSPTTGKERYAGFGPPTR